MLLCLVTADLTERYHAGKIIKEIAPLVGGSGGGRPDMAQAGGPHPEKLEQALAKIGELVLTILESHNGSFYNTTGCDPCSTS